MSAPVHIDGVSHRFGSFEALRHITLDIDAGEYVTLLGPSGCGKTTLLSVLGGFVHPSEGSVRIGGQDVTQIPPAKRPTTTVFQDYALFPHMTLADNVAFGLRMAGVTRRRRAEIAADKLALVGLAEAGRKRPHELSGGQRQRVALARALAVEPQVLLLDEPLGALDLKLRRQMQDELKSIQRQIGTTFVHVTHDQEEAMAIADRIVVMNAGRVEDAGTPERIYRQPASLFAAGFMGETNRIAARATGDAIETPLGLIPVAPPARGALVLCLRPEALGPSGGLALGRARIADAAFFGTYVRTHLIPEAAPDLTLVAHLPPAPVPQTGDVIDLCADTATLAVFPQE
ncbi:MAG: ABC transporter ATP-binding protein [Pseudomonadota bacterium]